MCVVIVYMFVIAHTGECIMKTSSVLSILLVFLSVTRGICINGSLPLPDGHLLAISVNENDEEESDTMSVFRIDFNGTVNKLWDFSLFQSDVLNNLNLFAVNIESKVVYVGSCDKFLALDLKTGTVKTEIHLLQYFWNYDYVARDNAIYGVCAGYEQWDWCRIKTGSNTIHLEKLYQMPYTTVLSPTNYVYYMDSKEQTIWYYPFDPDSTFAVGIDYTTGKEVFRSAINPNGTEDVCIVRDHVLDRVFTFVQDHNSSTAIGIGELFPQPEQKKMLIDFSSTEHHYYYSYGTCAYDENTNTMIGLMADSTSTATHLLLVNVISSTSKQIQLQSFPKNKSLTSIKFIPEI